MSKLSKAPVALAQPGQVRNAGPTPEAVSPTDRKTTISFQVDDPQVLARNLNILRGTVGMLSGVVELLGKLSESEDSDLFQGNGFANAHYLMHELSFVVMLDDLDALYTAAYKAAGWPLR
jgi:hypothetical protein